MALALPARITLPRIDAALARRVALVLLIVLLQWPLWVGKGSWFKVAELERRHRDAQAGNQKLEARNAVLDAEVRDLKDGLEAIEEYARRDLGMIKPGELLYQVVPAPGSTRPNAEGALPR